MKTHLMYRDKDFYTNGETCYGKEALLADLEIETMLKQMSRGDQDIYDSCSTALFQPLRDKDEIQYRQMNMKDCLRYPEAIRKLYWITQEAEKRRRSSFYWLTPGRNISSTYSAAAELLKIYIEMLMQLREVADHWLPKFHADGMSGLLSSLQEELNDRYFADISATLNELKDGKGTLISAKLGDTCQGVQYVLRSKKKKGFWWRWFTAPSYSLAPRDDAGAQDFENRRARAMNDCTNSLAQAAEHLEHFFAQLHKELAFYVGCINLHDDMERIGMYVCIPAVTDDDSARAWNQLYDISLAYTKNFPVVANTFTSRDKRLFIITGANQGGKSTFLRSIGQAQLMMQCGMIVAARSFAAPIRSGIFSHFKREEDSTYESGKLNEELSRMSEAITHMKRNALVLMNESFAATNEREGSEICRQVTSAFLDNGIEVFSVTHLFTYAISFQDEAKTQYLIAERKDNEVRSFRIIAGEPKQTAFGEDLWTKILTNDQKPELSTEESTPKTSS